MAFDQRAASPKSPTADPLLPQADSAQAHDIPTGVSPTTAKLQDWIAYLNTLKCTTFKVSADGSATSVLFAWSDISSSAYQNSTIYLDVPSCLANDTFIVSLAGNFRAVNAASDYNRIRMLGLDDALVTSVPNNLGGSADLFGDSAGTGVTYYGGVSLASRHVCSVAGTTRFMVQASIVSGSGNALSMRGGYSITATRVRP